MSYEDMNQLNTRILDHINTLCDQTQAAYASDQFQDWLRFCARFHTYSWRNQLLILWSCPDATLVKGRKDWESLGRAIKPEEEDRPIRIFAFRGYRRSEAKEETNTSKSEATDAEKPQSTCLSSGPRFSVVKVWDIAQTYGAELPAEPDWKSLERRTELEVRLLAFAQSKGIQVSIEALSGQKLGVSLNGAIAMKPEAGTSVWIHELAHELLQHHTALHGKQLSREEEEIEAESVAWVVSQHFGLEGVNSPNYLAGWGSTSKRIKAHMDRVAACAREIIAGVENLADSECTSNCEEAVCA